MNKLIVVILAVAVGGCFRPSSLKARAAELRAKIAVVVPIPAPVQVDPATLAALAAASDQDRQRREQPPPAHVDRDRSDRVRDRPAPTPAPTVIRKTAPAATYILRGETMGGAKICTKWTSMDECNADCTRQIREGAMAALGKGTNFTKNCVCVEGKGC